jgi:hypothetical protein
VVREFVQRRFGHTLSRSSCLQYLHRLDFVRKPPKKRLAKTNAARLSVAEHVRWLVHCEPQQCRRWFDAGRECRVHFASGLDHGLEITHLLAHLDLQAAALKCTLDHRA